MPDYKMIPVDDETYQMLLALCEAYDRKQGAQVKALVKAEYEKLDAVKLLNRGGKKAGSGETPTERSKKGE